MSMENLRRELEAVLLITDWSPTEYELREIASRIKRLGSTASKTDIEKVVYEVVGSY